MPATSIANGRTGEIREPEPYLLRQYVSLVRLGINEALSLAEVALRTIGRQLHVCEFWMPGGCNLRCTHCYVASWDCGAPLTGDEYAALTRHLVAAGLVDVVVPGMEPLLRSELWPILEAAQSSGARSIGITTNGTLIKRNLDRLSSSPLTTANVSLDGPEEIHDAIRGAGVFRVVTAGIRALRSRSCVRILTNSTLNKTNAAFAVELARIAADLGVHYAAFHPFETSAEIDNAQALTAEEVASVYERLIEAFRRGEVGSLVLETEASTFDTLLALSNRGVLADMTLVQDESGFLFFREAFGDRELLVNLMSYPHHYIRTVRVAHDGGLSSCRDMARSGWAGMGDVRTTNLRELLTTQAVVAGLAGIWGEFRHAVQRAPEGSVERFLDYVTSRAEVHEPTMELATATA